MYFDTDLARRLGKIRFVPVDVPTKVEPGGCVVYSTEVCRFDQTMGAGCGALGFTIFPILPRDLSPPQVISSLFAFIFFVGFLNLRIKIAEHSFFAWNQRLACS